MPDREAPHLEPIVSSVNPAAKSSTIFAAMGLSLTFAALAGYRAVNVKEKPLELFSFITASALFLSFAIKNINTASEKHDELLKRFNMLLEEDNRETLSIYSKNKAIISEILTVFSTTTSFASGFIAKEEKGLYWSATAYISALSLFSTIGIINRFIPKSKTIETQLISLQERFRPGQRQQNHQEHVIIPVIDQQQHEQQNPEIIATDTDESSVNEEETTIDPNHQIRLLSIEGAQTNEIRETSV